MQTLAGGGAVKVLDDWKGVAPAFGRDRISTFTCRCSKRDSVKNLAFEIKVSKSLN
jgi:hypothetical protein